MFFQNRPTSKEKKSYHILQIPILFENYKQKLIILLEVLLIDEGRNSIKIQ